MENNLNLVIKMTKIDNLSTTSRVKKVMTSAEIIQKEEDRIRKKKFKMGIIGDYKLTIVKIFNEAWNKGRDKGIQELIETWTKEGETDPVIENLRKVFKDYGGKTVLKLLNSSYLNEVEGCCQMNGRRKYKVKKIKYSFEKNEDSKKTIKIQEAVNEAINKFINQEVIL